jgi:hypothetical protein
MIDTTTLVESIPTLTTEKELISTVTEIIPTSTPTSLSQPQPPQPQPPQPPQPSQSSQPPHPPQPVPVNYITKDHQLGWLYHRGKHHTNLCIKGVNSPNSLISLDRCDHILNKVSSFSNDQWYVPTSHQGHYVNAFNTSLCLDLQDEKTVRINLCSEVPPLASLLYQKNHAIQQNQQCVGLCSSGFLHSLCQKECDPTSPDQYWNFMSN